MTMFYTTHLCIVHDNGHLRHHDRHGAHGRIINQPAHLTHLKILYMLNQCYYLNTIFSFCLIDKFSQDYKDFFELSY